jgi:hypothetical protein
MLSHRPLQPRHRTHRPRVALAIATGGLLLLTACSSSSEAAVATVDGTTGGASASPTATADADTQRLEFLSCLRDQGVDIPDDAGPQELASIDQGALQTALEQCEDLRPTSAGGIDGPLTGDAQARILALAACMRQEGIDFPDPSFDAQGRLQFGAGGPGIDPNDPAVAQALGTCSEQVGFAPAAPGAGGN